jgi:hypothetical protein
MIFGHLIKMSFVGRGKREKVMRCSISWGKEANILVYISYIIIFG